MHDSCILKQWQAEIGYCLQLDCLLHQLTAIETLRLFCSLRGVPKSEVEGHISDIIGLLALRIYANNQCGTYRFVFSQITVSQGRNGIVLTHCSSPPVAIIWSTHVNRRCTFLSAPLRLIKSYLCL